MPAWAGFDRASAQLDLGAPAVGEQFREVSGLPFAESAPIGLFYKYVFSGIQLQCDVDGVPGAYAYDGQMWDAPPGGGGGTGAPVTMSNGASGKGSSSAVTVTFSADGKSIFVTSSKDLSNVVLGFTDGTHYKFDGLTGKTATFSGVGGNAGKLIKTAWIKSGSYMSGDGPGYGYRFDGPQVGPAANPVEGHIEVWGKVNTVELRSLSHVSSELDAMSPVLRKYFTTPVVFREQNITLNWEGDGNSQNSDGHFYLLGSAIKDPPVPTGQLTISQLFYWQGTYPLLNWSIHRED